MSINLSILDFKALLCFSVSFAFGTINLSILDFKGNDEILYSDEWQNYKSIHIGF